MGMPQRVLRSITPSKSENEASRSLAGAEREKPVAGGLSLLPFRARMTLRIADAALVSIELIGCKTAANIPRIFWVIP